MFAFIEPRKVSLGPFLQTTLPGSPPILSKPLQSLRIFREIMLEALLKSREVISHLFIHSLPFIYWASYRRQLAWSGTVCFWEVCVSCFQSCLLHFMQMSSDEICSIIFPKVWKGYSFCSFWNRMLHLSLFSHQGPTPITTTFRRSLCFQFFSELLLLFVSQSIMNHRPYHIVLYPFCIG